MRSTVNSGDVLRSEAPRANNKTRATRSGLRLAGVSSVSLSGLFRLLPYRRHARALLDAPRRAEASYHAPERAYNRAPCPPLSVIACLSCPTSRSSPMRSTRRSSAGEWWAPRCHSRSCCAGRRRSSPRSTASCCARSQRRGKFLVFDFERDRIVFNPMLTGRLGWRSPGPRRGRSGPRRSSSAPSTRRLRESLMTARAREGTGPTHDWPGRRRLAAAARPGRRAALPRRDSDGQDLPHAGAAWSGPSRAGTSRALTRTIRL